MIDARLRRRHRYPPQMIAYTVWLCFRLLLSLRMIEDLLAEARWICTDIFDWRNWWCGALEGQMFDLAIGNPPAHFSTAINT